MADTKTYYILTNSKEIELYNELNKLNKLNKFTSINVLSEYIKIIDILKNESSDLSIVISSLDNLISSYSNIYYEDMYFDNNYDYSNIISFIGKIKTIINKEGKFENYKRNSLIQVKTNINNALSKIYENNSNNNEDITKLKTNIENILNDNQELAEKYSSQYNSLINNGVIKRTFVDPSNYSTYGNKILNIVNCKETSTNVQELPDKYLIIVGNNSEYNSGIGSFTYIVTLNVINGTKIPNSTQTVTKGNSVSWTVIANDGYELPSSVEGATISGNTITVNNVTADKTINVICTETQVVPPTSTYYFGILPEPNNVIDSNYNVNVNQLRTINSIDDIADSTSNDGKGIKHEFTTAHYIILPEEFYTQIIIYNNSGYVYNTTNAYKIKIGDVYYIIIEGDDNEGLSLYDYIFIKKVAQGEGGHTGINLIDKTNSGSEEPEEPSENNYYWYVGYDQDAYDNPQGFKSNMYTTTTNSMPTEYTHTGDVGLDVTSTGTRPNYLIMIIPTSWNKPVIYGQFNDGEIIMTIEKQNISITGISGVTFNVYSGTGLISDSQVFIN